MAPPIGHPRYGGRGKGSRNKRTLLSRDALCESGATLNGSGQAPLEFLISVMRNEALDLPIRLDAAKSAAPYLHPKLNMVEARVGVHTAPVRQLSEADLNGLLAAIAKKDLQAATRWRSLV